MTQNVTMITVDQCDSRLATQAAKFRLQIEQLEARCKMMQQIANQYMEDRQLVCCNLSVMGLRLHPDNTITVKGQS